MVEGRTYVLQPCVSDLMLLDGRKFGLRTHALVCYYPESHPASSDGGDSEGEEGGEGGGLRLFVFR